MLLCSGPQQFDNQTEDRLQDILSSFEILWGAGQQRPQNQGAGRPSLLQGSAYGSLLLLRVPIHHDSTSDDIGAEH